MRIVWRDAHLHDNLEGFMLKLLKETVTGTAIYSLSNLSTKVAGFILIPFYTQHLPTAAFGVLSLLEAASLAIISIFGLNLHSAFMRWYYDKDYKEKQKSLFFTSATFLAAFALVVTLVLVGLSRQLSILLFESADMQRLVLYMVASSFLQILTNIPTMLLRLHEKAVTFVWFNAIRLIVIIAATIILLQFYSFGLEGIMIAQLAGNLIYLVLLTPHTLANLTFHFESRALKEMVNFSLPLTYASVSNMIITIADKFLLSRYSGLALTGIYSFGFRIANTVYYLAAESFNFAIYPTYFKVMYDEGSKRFYAKMMTYSVMVLVVIVLGLSLFSQELILLLSQKDAYNEAYRIVPIIAFAGLFMMMRDNAGRALTVVKKNVTRSVIIIVVSLINLILNLVLIRYYDQYGAACSFLLTQMVNFALVLYFAQKYYPISYEWKKLLIMVLYLIAMLLFSIYYFREVTVLNAVLKVAMIAVFPLVLYWLDFYEPVELERLRGFWKKWRNPLRWSKNFHSNFK